MSFDARTGMDRKDRVGDFLRKISKEVRLAGAGYNQICLTADGTILDKKGAPRRGWKAWESLSENQRKPGALELPSTIIVDIPNAIRRPPKGTLVIKQYYRMMAYTKEEKLRYVTAKDFATPIGNNQSGRVNSAFHTTHPDFLWLLEREWKSLIPEQPMVGKSFAVSDAIAERIYRFHLNPYMSRGESTGLKREQYSRGKLMVTVERVTGQTVTMKLSGSVQIGTSFDAVQKRRDWGYAPMLKGKLKVDRHRGRFTQFDVVALGDYWGQLGRDDPFYRPGRQPLGIAFEMVDSRIDRNQVAPRGAYRDNLKSYLGAR